LPSTSGHGCGPGRIWSVGENPSQATAFGASDQSTPIATSVAAENSSRAIQRGIRAGASVFPYSIGAVMVTSSLTQTRRSRHSLG
jgi:hypothetical protein